MTRVAVTGATGFIGLHVARALAARGDRVTAVVRPTSDASRLPPGTTPAVAALQSASDLARAFAGCDAVVHLAGAVDFGADWERFERVNVGGTRAVLAAAAGRRVVHCSSIVAVGASRGPVKLDESARWNLGPCRVPYVTTKRRAEELALATPGVVVVNPACVLGPDDFASSEFGTLCRRFWRGRLPVHFGGGNNFADVRDVAAGVLAALDRGRPGHRYILGGANRSLTGFFGELAAAAGQPIPRCRLPGALASVVAWAEERLGRRRRRRAYLSPAQARLLPWFFYFDSAKARRELGYATRPLASTLADAFRFWHSRAA
jgi:dihydroflavonol-4-reductase